MSKDASHKTPVRVRAAGGRGAVLLAAGLAIVGSVGIASAGTQRKDFTRADVESIATTLREADPEIYLIRLPVFRDGRLVGSQMYGSLPMREVEQFARSIGVPLDRNANILAIFDPTDPGDELAGCDGGDGGGPGSHTQSASGGRILADRLESHLAEIEASSYQFLR